MKKLIAIIMLVLLLTAFEKDKQVINNKKLSLLKENITHKTKEEINSEIPSKYTFDWKITYEMETNNTKIDCHYMVKPKASYFGVVMVLNGKDLSKNSITIKDFGRHKSLNLRNKKGGKFLYVKDMPELKDNIDQSITIERIDSKNILGTRCQGYKINMNAGTGTLYMTQEVGFAFNKDFEQYSKKRLEGKGIDANILNELESGLMMEMSFIGNGTNSSATSSKMTIKEMTEMKFSVDLNGYKIISR